MAERSNKLLDPWVVQGQQHFSHLTWAAVGVGSGAVQFLGRFRLEGNGDAMLSLLSTSVTAAIPACCCFPAVTGMRWPIRRGRSFWF